MNVKNLSWQILVLRDTRIPTKYSLKKVLEVNIFSIDVQI